jgi:hypothetical protein
MTASIDTCWICKINYVENALVFFAWDCYRFWGNAKQRVFFCKIVKKIELCFIVKRQEAFVIQYTKAINWITCKDKYIFVYTPHFSPISYNNHVVKVRCAFSLYIISIGFCRFCFTQKCFWLEAKNVCNWYTAHIKREKANLYKNRYTFL